MKFDRIEKIYLGLCLLGIPVFFFHVPVGIGWSVGHLVMIILSKARKAFYRKLLDVSSFRVRNYVSYVAFTMGLIALPLLGSFLYPKVAEPLAIFAAYFVDRILNYIVNLFAKGRDANAS